MRPSAARIAGPRTVVHCDLFVPLSFRLGYGRAMAKPQKRYVCQQCGSVASKWAGQCVDCGDWNTLVEDAGAVVTPFAAKHNLQSGGRAIQLSGLDTDIPLPERMATGIAELDRALGGGFVEGSATLLGGDPGARGGGGWAARRCSSPPRRRCATFSPRWAERSRPRCW